MRMLLKAQLSVEKANEAIREGRLQEAMEATLSSLKPEAAYFTVENGTRTAFIVFDMQDASQMPVIAEPLFMGLDASIDFTPVMDAADLKKGLQQAMG